MGGGGGRMVGMGTAGLSHNLLEEVQGQHYKQIELSKSESFRVLHCELWHHIQIFG